MPGAFHTSRARPESAGLGATLKHVGGWPVLSITGSPQTLELELVNRTPHRLTAGPAHLRLSFRPGILASLDTLVLAPQSEAAWSLTIEQPHPHGNVTLVLAGVDRFTLAPGEAMAVRFDGVSAEPAGGSRATRVQLQYRGFAQPSGAAVAGSRLLHLPVLRRHEPVGPPATELRSASQATSGPFMAGFIDGADVLNDGKSSNTLRLRIVNTSGRALELSHADDAATRFYLSFRTGTAAARWGLIEAQTDHVGLALAEQPNDRPAWQVDAHTLRRVRPGRWRPLEALDLELTVHSNAPPGEAQLILSYENLPHDDDGDLVLLVRLGPSAARADALVSVAPIELRGRQARLSFHPEESLGAQAAGLPAPSISANRQAGSVGRLDVDAPAGMHVSGDLAVTGMLRTPETFTLGGATTQYYPVVFEDMAWDRGELRFEIFRADTHVDGPWHGALMASIQCHADIDGNGASYWAIEARQWSSAPTHQRLIGGFENDVFQPLHVVWLAGGTTYSWRAEHPARLVAPADLANPSQVTLGTGPTVTNYAVLSAPRAGFDADHLDLRRITSGLAGAVVDVGPVPAGAIVFWPRLDPVPYGWALCDGVQAQPDLNAMFTPLLKCIRKL